MNSRMAILVIALALTLSAPQAFCQDPGAPDSLAFGNPDGSPIQVLVDSEVRVPVYIKSDENIAFIHFCLATDNFFIAQRDYFIPDAILDDWNLEGTLPADGWPSDGYTSQSLVGIADFSEPEPVFINTNYEWILVGEYLMQTTDNPDAMGQLSPLIAGEDPVEGLTVLFDETFAPIVPGMIFSSLEFLEATPPVFTSPSPDTLINVNNHYSLSFIITLTDIDEDIIDLAVSMDYEDYELIEIINEPGEAEYMFTWTPPSECIGTVPVLFTATDEGDLSRELTIDINVEPVGISVTADTTLYGYTSSVDVFMDISGSNSNVGAFDLVLDWDAEILTGIDVDFSPDFAEWEYTNATFDNTYGNITLVGLANFDTGDVPPLTQGTYHIATIEFQTAADPDLQGFFVNLEMPTPNLYENVLTDSSGYIIYHPGITEGYIFFMNIGDVIIGDVNLNLFPYETGDVVTFIDHLVNPTEYPFNPVQRIASDCNEDMIPETVADLVYMINVVNGGTLNEPLPYEGAIPQITIEQTNAGFDIVFESESPISAALVRLNIGDSEILDVQTDEGVEVSFNNSDDTFSVIAYSGQINDDISGKRISLNADINIESIEIEFNEFSTSGGQLIR